MEYVKGSKNNKLKQSCTEFDIVYDYFMSMVKTTNESKESIYEKFTEFEKNQPVIVNNEQLPNIMSSASSDNEHELSSEEEMKTQINDIDIACSSIPHDDDNLLNQNRRRYCLTSVSHPDYPYKSVPFVSFFKDDDTSYYLHDDDDEYVCNEIVSNEQSSENSEDEYSD